MSDKTEMLQTLSKFFSENGTPADRSEYSALADVPYTVSKITRRFRRFSALLKLVDELPVAKAVVKEIKKEVTKVVKKKD